MKNFILPDTHCAPESHRDLNGGHDEGAFKTALKAMSIIKPRRLVHLGDLGEWASCSPWQYKKRARPGLQYTIDRLMGQEVPFLNKILDRLDETAEASGVKKKVLIEGNHEIWVSQMMEEMDLARHTYALPKVLKLRQRGWSWVPYGKFYGMGKLNLYHGGHYWGKYHAPKHIAEIGDNVMYGHTHDVQTATRPSLKGVYGAWSMGCLCKLEKAFMKGRRSNWQHAFGVVHLRPGGDFKVDVHRIEKGWTIVDGTEIINGRSKK